MKSKGKISKKSPPTKNSQNWKEANRILSRNLSRNDVNVNEESIPFIKNFIFSLIKEAEEVEQELPTTSNTLNNTQKDPKDFTPEQDKKAFDNALGEKTPENQFDVKGTDPANTAQHIEQIQDWTNQLEEFTKFLNSPKAESLHKILADYDRPGSLMRGITRKASDSITRIAGEIAKLSETLNGFINMAPKKQRDLNQSTVS